jgi:hypothetical protein
MNCIRCGKPSVIYQRYSGRHLCADHLSADIERRAKRVIRQNRWLVRGDWIGVISGMPGSAPLCVFLKHLVARRRDIRVVSICLPQLHGDRSGVSWYRTLSPLLSQSGVTRLALPDCAGDLAEQTLFQIFAGDEDVLLSSEIPGLTLPFMQPFREIPAEELHLYYQYYHRDINEDTPDTPLNINRNSMSPGIHSLLGDFSSHHPSAPHALRRYRDNLRDLANAD